MSDALLNACNLLENECQPIDRELGNTVPMPLLQPETIATYQRVSSDEQSTSMQADWLRRLMLTHDLDYENAQHFIDEDTSATKYGDIERRPQGAKLVNLIKKNGISKLFVYRLDRLFRDSAFAMMFLKLLSKYNVELYSSDFAGNVASADGRFQYGMQMLLAERESGVLGERVKDKMSQNLHDLIPNYKVPPYGWDIIGKGDPRYNGGKGQIDINWHEQMVIKWAKEQNLSNAKIADKLNDRNITSKTGKKWSPSAVYRLGNNETQKELYDRFASQQYPSRPIQYPFRPLQNLDDSHYSKY
tara:strand:+ start:158 stop:1063 length:906 start_codon:yes stop_codon:yes gene_type:complete